MSPTVGLFVEGTSRPDWIWHQCDGPEGRHGDLLFRAEDSTADVVVALGTPTSPGGGSGLTRWDRLLAGLLRDRPRRRLAAAWRRARPPSGGLVALFLEPPPQVSNLAYAVARRQALRVYGPDDRATHPCALPAWWELERDVAALRDASPPAKTVPLAAVVSGKSWLPGHRTRLAFLERLRRAGVPFELFGRALPSSLGGRGPAASKAAVFEPARLVLAIENFAEGDRYVTEKLWDPLLAWALPLYHGSRAADRLVPPEAFVRLPDLGDAGVATVVEVLAQPRLWTERLDAIARARRNLLGGLRLVEWIRRELLVDRA